MCDFCEVWEGELPGTTTGMHKHTQLGGLGTCPPPPPPQENSLRWLVVGFGGEILSP